MPATLLHLTYDMARAGDDYAFMTLSFLDKPVEEMRATAQRLLAAGDYWAVAEFDDSDPATVWRLAQNLGERSPSWSRLPPEGVRPLGDGTVFGGLGYRSSMAGDIVVVDGRCLVFANALVDIGPLPDGVTLEHLPRPKEDGAPPEYASETQGSKPPLGIPDADASKDFGQAPALLGIAFEGDTLVATFDNGRGLLDDAVQRIPVEMVPWLANSTTDLRKGFVVSPFGVVWLMLDRSLRAEDLIELAAQAAAKPSVPRG